MKYKMYVIMLLNMMVHNSNSSADQASIVAIDNQKIQIAVDARETKKVPVILFYLSTQDEKSQTAEHVLATVVHDLAFTDLFAPSIVWASALPSKKQLQTEYGSLATAVSITEPAGKDFFVIRLYNVAKGSVINRKEYKVYKRGNLQRGWGHAIADLIVEILTGRSGCFSSKLAYCKQLAHDTWGVGVSDYDGQHETIVAKAGLIIGSRWHADQDAPAVLFSKYTTSNIRLMKIDVINGQQTTAVSFEGLNMLPSFAPDGSELIVCLSCSGSSQLYSYAYDAYAKRMKYKQLTFNDGNNIAPTVLENGDIIFCSDYEDGRPRLYYLNRSTSEIVRVLKSNEMCFSPVYCPTTNKLVFSKILEGVGQIFIYDFATSTERQVTHDALHKQEPCWSPCGTYIAFEVQQGKDKRIAVQDVVTGHRTYVTPAGMVCSYPTWSANFVVFPSVRSCK